MRNFSLKELSDLAELNPRTVRSYVAQGLLPGPDSMGPKASYDTKHLVQLLAIKVLKDQDGESLKAIRQSLGLMSELEVSEIAARYPGGPDLEIVSYFGASDKAEPPPSSNQDENLKLLEHHDASLLIAAERRHVSEFVGDSDGAILTPLDRLIRLFKEVLGSRPHGGYIETNHWNRISITPDIELHVRGEIDKKHLANLQLISNYMREILGGTSRK